MQQNGTKVIFASLAGLLALSQIAVAQQPSWLNSVDEAAAAATRSGKMIVISVAADWCHHCHRMDRETWTNGKVKQAIQQSYIPLKLTDEQHHQYLEAMQVTALPTTLIFSSDKQLLTRLDGYVDATKMAQVLERTRIAEHQRATETPPIR